MNINRHNYEEFFILYMDNELSSEDRRQVELFVNENPDLNAELNLLLQSQLTPDASVVFTDKEQLMKSSLDLDSINHSNYEEWLLSYVDNELSADQKVVVEKFVSSHPEIKTELDYLQKTKSQPDHAVVFANKEILYRKEEKVRVIAISWKRIAIAASLLLAVSTTAFILINNKKDNQQGIVSNQDEKKSIPKNSNPVVKQPANEIAATEEKTTIPFNTTDVVEDKVVENNDPVDAKRKTIEQKQKTVPYLPSIIEKDKPVIADRNEKETNNLSQPTNDNPYINKSVEEKLIARAEPIAKDPLTNLKETNNTTSVTLNKPQPLDHVVTAASIEPVDEEQPGKKNKLRGFFRKITRTFEKNTNIKATDDEDRLLLGGLAIQL